MGLDYLHRVCQIIHTDLKPENVNLCLTDQEVKEIASRGQLTTTKMFELPEDLKKISAGKINEVQANITKKEKDQQTVGNQVETVLDHRGRTEQKEDDEASILDKAAKRAAKKRRQKERKREEKLRALQKAKEQQQKEQKAEEERKQESSKNPRPKTAKFKKQGGTNLTKQNESASKQSSMIYKQDSALERQAKKFPTK